jgi:acyl-CoA synthetase (AMP-forming)/AMP-acid ligase II
VSVAAERFGDAEALVDGDARLSFRDLAAAVRRAAKGFVAAGVAPGDRVGIWAPNVGEWVAAALGVHAAGAVLVPVNTRFKGEEAAWVLGRSGARVVLTVTGFLGTDYVGMLQRGPRRGMTSSPPATASTMRRSIAARPPWVRTTPRTSSSPPAPPAAPRAW